MPEKWRERRARKDAEKVQYNNASKPKNEQPAQPGEGQPSQNARGSASYYGSPSPTWSGTMKPVTDKQYSWLPVEADPQLANYKLQISQQAAKPYRDQVSQMAGATYEQNMAKKLGYKPSFFEDPARVAGIYHAWKSAPEGSQTPDWLDMDKLGQAYEYMKFRNQDKPWTEWQYLPPDDPGRGFLQSMGTPPAEFLRPKEAETYANPEMVKQGQMAWNDLSPDVRANILSDPTFYEGGITEYPEWARQEILADPNFDWDRLPKKFGINWQHFYYGLSSSPAGMGAVQGGLMGATGGAGGLVIGGALGAGIGALGAKAGYDPTKEFWQQGDNKFTWDLQQGSEFLRGALGAMNFLAEQAEKGIGLGVQAIGAAVDPNVALSDVLTKEGWQAGATTFEAMAPALNMLGQEWSLQNWSDFDLGDAAKLISSPIYAAYKLTDLMLNPDKYKGTELVLGSNVPVELQQNFQERMTEARQRIKNGEDYRQVALEFQQGVMGQIGDMMGQAIADPLNVAPEATTKVTGKALDAAGFSTAAKAAEMADSPMGAVQAYKGLVQSGNVPDSFKYTEMSPVARFLGDVTLNEQGQPVIKAGAFSNQGLLDVPQGGWLKQQVTLDPKSRLLEGHHLAQEHLMQIMTQFDDLHDLQKVMDAIAKSDLETARDLAGNLANSPEWYTVLPALKEFDGVEKIVNAWDASEGSRSLLYDIADALGEEPRSILDELARDGGIERTMQRITALSNDLPESKGRLTVSTEQLSGLKELFTGAEPVPWHPDLAKATISNNLQKHFADWGVKYFNLKQDAVAFRLADTAKKFQGMLMLGGSPSYPINNQLSNMVMRAVTGNFGYLTSKAIDGFFKDFGYTPHDSGVGVGAFGDPNLAKAGNVNIGEASLAEKGNLGVAISEATGSTGNWKKVNDMFSAANRALPFGKLSRVFEGLERQNALAISMKKIWPRLWERGKGFSEMEAGLRGRLEAAHPGASELIYRGIESGMNAKQIEQAIFNQSVGLQARGLVERAAAALGMEKADAAAMLDQMGVFEGLDAKLSRADTPEKVAQVFRDAERTARENFIIQRADESLASAQVAFDRVKTEGPTAAVDIFVDIELMRNDLWLEHYATAGETAAKIDTNPEWEGPLWDQFYRDQEQAYRNINSEYLSKFKGVVEALSGKGRESVELVDLMGREFQNWDETYKFMREERRKYFSGDASYPDRASVEGAIDQRFKQARANEAQHMQAIGELVAGAFGERFGPEAGTVFLNKWGDILKFREQMWGRLQSFRESVLGQPRDVAAAMKHEFYQNEYMPMVVEMGRLKGELGGQQAPLPPSGDIPPSPPAQPSAGRPPISDEIGGQTYADELAMKKQAQAEADTARVSAVWDVASEYDNTFTGFDRSIVQDKFALLNALRDDSYGGIPDLTGLNDGRITPEFVRQVLEARDQAQANAITAETQSAQGEIAYTGPKINDNTSLLRAIQQHGGIDKGTYALDVTGERNPRTAPGVWTLKGVGLDEMARMLVEDGYPIDLNTADGGVAQLTEMIRQAQSGDKIFPMGHDFEKALADQQQLRAETQLDAQMAAQQRDIWQIAGERGIYGLDEAGNPNTDAALALIKIVKKYGGEDGAFVRTIEDVTPDLLERSFANRDIFMDSRVIDVKPEQYQQGLDDLWGRVEKAEQGKNLDKQMGQMLRLRSELGNALATMPKDTPEMLVNSYAFLAQQLDEKIYNLDQATRMTELNRRWYRETGALNSDARRILNRNLVKEQLLEVRPDAEQVDAVMALMDARAEAWSWNSDRPADEWYSTRIGGVEQGGSGELMQLQPVNRAMSSAEVERYARALSRTNVDEIRRAVTGESDQAARVKLLDEVHKLAPDLAEETAAQVRDYLFQSVKEGVEPKGAVSFLEDGRAIIHAFESADVSTVVHEVGHIFRRDLEGADLDTIEKWAGVRDGNWERTHEEKFARAFEKYLADGQAPTKPLQAVFAKFKRWMNEVYRALRGSPIDVELPENVRQVFDGLLSEPFAEKPSPSMAGEPPPLKIQSANEGEARTLYQDADPRVPNGMYEQTSGWHGEGSFNEDGWNNYVSPLLGAMESEAVRQLDETPFRYADLDAQTQKDLRRYVNQVKNDMATAKLSTVRYGEGMRDFALLNYNRRYGFDKMLDVWAPYQFFYTRSALNGLARVIDKPSWFANYARLQMMQNRYENNLPERLRGKIRIPAPWQPDWMGDALYVDPRNVLFQFGNYIQPIERITQDKKYVEIQAERILQEWASDGTMSMGDLEQAFNTHDGATWEKAMAEAAQRRDYEQASPLDLAAMYLSPAWYLKNPWYDVTGKLGGYSGDTQLPITRAGQAFETVTKDTWAEPVGKFLGLFAKPEAAGRKAGGLEEFGQLDIYYTKRQAANMVADGLITAEQAQQAMIEQSGPVWEQARERVKLELAMRTPLAASLYATTHQGAGAGLATLPASLLGSGLLPEGELRYRGLKEKWDAAWKAYDAGDKQALSDFFDDHPEYEAYMAKNKDEGELLRSFLVGQIWDNYMSIDKPNRKVVTGQMGNLFRQSFLNKETRSYDSIDTQTLAMWARELGGQVPQTQATESVTQAPQYQVQQIEGIPTPISASLNTYEVQKAEMFPGINDIQGMYYDTPKSERRRILQIFPQLREYWDWRRGYINDHPEAAQFLDSDTAEKIVRGEIRPVGMDQEQARRLLMYYRPTDFAAPARTADYYLQNASPILSTEVLAYALQKQPLDSGAQKELQMIWEENGKPGGSLQEFLDSVIVPTLGYE